MSFIKELPIFVVGLFNYSKSIFNKSKIKLAVAMQVKDEIDILELNIRYHHKKNCMAFFIMDNGSTDGTLEVLKKLKSEFNIYIYEDSTLSFIDSSKNMTFLTHEARKNGYDWVIENDADEFWFPKNGDGLDQVLDRRKTVIKVPLYHMQTTTENCSKWWTSPFRTHHTLNYDFSDQSIEAKKTNIRLGSGTHKVMVNVNGFVRVTGGNHSARHAWDKLRGRRHYEYTKDICIYHFGIRSLEQFITKIRNIDKSVTYSEANGKKHGFSKWALLWRTAYINGDIEMAYKRMLLYPDCLDCYRDIGLIVDDESLLKDLDFIHALKEVKSYKFY